MSEVIVYRPAAQSYNPDTGFYWWVFNASIDGQVGLIAVISLNNDHSEDEMAEAAQQFLEDGGDTDGICVLENDGTVVAAAADDVGAPGDDGAVAASYDDGTAGANDGGSGGGDNGSGDVDGGGGSDDGREDGGGATYIPSGGGEEEGRPLETQDEDGS